MTRESSLSTKYLLCTEIANTQQLFRFFLFSCLNTDNSSKTPVKMEGYRLLEQDEPASDDRETRPTPRPCYQASQPILIVSVVLGAMLLLLSAGGNLFQYWYSGYGNDDTYRSQFGGSAALDGMRGMLRR